VFFFLRCNRAQVYLIVRERKKEVNNTALTAAILKFIGISRFVTYLNLITLVTSTITQVRVDGFSCS